MAQNGLSEHSMMKMIRIELVPNSLEVSLNLPLFVVGEKLRLVWKPGFDWPATLNEIERQPLPWVGSRELEAKKLVEALKKPPKEVREAKEAQFLAGINAQGQIGLQAARY